MISNAKSKKNLMAIFKYLNIVYCNKLVIMRICGRDFKTFDYIVCKINAFKVNKPWFGALWQISLYEAL